MRWGYITWYKNYQKDLPVLWCFYSQMFTANETKTCILPPPCHRRCVTKLSDVITAHLTWLIGTWNNPSPQRRCSVSQQSIMIWTNKVQTVSFNSYQKNQITSFQNDFILKYNAIIALNASLSMCPKPNGRSKCIIQPIFTLLIRGMTYNNRQADNLWRIFIFLWHISARLTRMTKQHVLNKYFLKRVHLGNLKN